MPEKMWVAGIDPDTKNITASFEPLYEGATQLIRFESKGRLAETRFPELIGQFRQSTAMFKKCRWVYIERPPMGVNPRSTIDQARVLGAIEECFLREGISYSLVDPGTWKKGLIGRGNADKALIKEWSLSTGRIADGLPQDFYDAFCIARWGAINLSASLVNSGAKD